MMEASLEKIRKIVVFRCTDESGNIGTCKRTRARVKVVQEKSERLWIKLDYHEL